MTRTLLLHQVPALHDRGQLDPFNQRAHWYGSKLQNQIDCVRLAALAFFNIRWSCRAVAVICDRYSLI